MAKILLAEDDLFLRDIYSEVLLDEGFEITLAEDGSEALQKIKQGGWDLVLLDVVMPKMTGIDVLKKVKEDKARSYAKHVVFMTNSDEREELQEVESMIDGYLLKSSFTPDQLVAKLKEYLNS